MIRLLTGTLALAMVLAGSTAWAHERSAAAVSDQGGAITAAVYHGDDAIPAQLVNRRGYYRYQRGPIQRYVPRSYYRYRSPTYRNYYHHRYYRPGYSPYYYNRYPYGYRGYYPYGGYFYYGGPRLRFGLGF